MVFQGKFDHNNQNIDISQSQFVLNWLANGGDLADASNGDNRVFGVDTSYNIKDNAISFNHKDSDNPNISVFDAQYIINWEKGGGTFNIDNGTGTDGSFAGVPYPKPISYEYPSSRDFVCLVEHKDFSIGDKTYHKNKLYLKRKNKNVKDVSFSNYILTNSIQYLGLDDPTHIYKWLDIFPPINGKTKDSTYLNINENFAKETIYKTTKLSDTVDINNRGVESIDISNSIDNSRLVKFNTFSSTTINLLTESGMNKTNWVMSGQQMNDSQSHFIGQFVFDASAQGTMIYQYYYDTNTKDTQYEEDSPHTIYFNIGDGKLEFLEENMNKSRVTDNGSVRDLPWGTDESGKIAYIFADINKTQNLLFCYGNIVDKKIKFKEWNNFRVIDSSRNAIDFSFASWPTDQTNITKINNTIKAVEAMLLANPPDISDTIIFINNQDNMLDIKYNEYNNQRCISGNMTTIKYLYHKNSVDEKAQDIISIFLGNTIKIINNKTFTYLSNIKHIILGKSIENIQFAPFRGSKNLKNITIPRDVSLNYSAFLFSETNEQGRVSPSNAYESKLENIIFLGQNPQPDKLKVESSSNEIPNYLHLWDDLSSCNFYYIDGEEGWTDMSFVIRNMNSWDLTTTGDDIIKYIIPKQFPFD